MIATLAISAGAQLLTAGIDALRIRLRWAKTGNIEHAISCSIGAAAAAGQWFSERPDWRWWTFLLLAVGMRLALFDILLNLFRREQVDYESLKTNARTASWWRRWKVSFWGQRAIGAVLALIASLIQNFWT